MRALAVVAGFLAFGCGDKSRAGGPDRDLPFAVRSIVQFQSCADSNEAGCIDSLIALGTSHGSVMRYFPADTDSVTKVARYWVMSRDANGEAGRPAFLGDAYGQLFETRYDSSWDKSGPDSLARLLFLRTPVPYLRSVFDCIKGTYGSYLGEYPQDLSNAGHREPPGRCISFPDRSYAVFEVDPGNRVGAGKFNVRYEPSEPDSLRGYPTSFSLEAWPVTYGDASIRSFFVDTAGDIHFTTENRRATAADPLVFGCEGRDLPYDCSVAIARSVKLTGHPPR